MSHYRRAIVPGGVFFFTAVTHQRRPIFSSRRSVSALRAAFRQVQAARPFVIDAMVVLPDHLHCIWRLPDGDSDYSGRWREIKKAASHRIAPSSDGRGERQVWQRRFWEHLIRDDDDWHRHVAYIHYNPVKHGLADSPAAWPWSSFSRAVARGWHDPSWGGAEPEIIKGLNRE